MAASRWLPETATAAPAVYYLLSLMMLLSVPTSQSQFLFPPPQPAPTPAPTPTPVATPTTCYICGNALLDITILDADIFIPLSATTNSTKSNSTNSTTSDSMNNSTNSTGIVSGTNRNTTTEGTTTNRTNVTISTFGSCNDFRTAGLNGEISETNCRALEELVFEDCGCAPPPGREILTVPDPSKATNGTDILCWNDLTILDQTEISNETDFTEYRKFILCPDTTYTIAFQTNSGSFRDGQRPIFVGPNQHIQCGADGSSVNSCRLRSGTFQLAVVDIGNFSRMPNITVQGITFDGPFQASVFLGYPGSITFIDCIFENQRNFGVIIGQVPLPLFSPSGGDGRRLTADLEDEDRPRLTGTELDLYRKEQIDRVLAETTREHQQRSLQSIGVTLPDGQTRPDDASVYTLNFADELKLFVEFHSCTFQNNALGTVRPGIITMTGPLSPIIADRCIFLNNDYSEAERSWAINTDSKLTLTNSCFINSEFQESIIRLNLIVAVNGFVAQNNTIMDKRPECDILFFDTDDDDEGRCEVFPNPSDICLAYEDSNAPGGGATPPSRPVQRSSSEKKQCTGGLVSTLILSIVLSALV